MIEALYFLAQCLDVLTTLYGLHFVGLIEGNPIADWIIQYDPWLFAAVKIGPAFLIIMLRQYLTRFWRRLILFTTVLLGFCIFNNLFLIFLYGN